jgi:protein tyrosine phosphatase
LTKTVVDFWRLIWQERPPVIVMVTNLKEDKKVKCQQYWPDTETKEFGPFSVTLTSEHVFTDYTIRELTLELVGSNEYEHKLIQYHYTSWPDHGVPEYATSVLQFHKRIKKEYTPRCGPLLIHCSAGVGRTGTFITIDIVLQQAMKEKCIDIVSVINKMRHQRMKMVQTVDQFMFVNDAILEAVTCGETQIDASNAHHVINKMKITDPHTHRTAFEEQFNVLEQVTQKPNEIRRDTALTHQDKNRSDKFLPR